jgi:HD-GYP domain-containing protein (c-di-GMP phosphodiesterase class II)
MNQVTPLTPMATLSDAEKKVLANQQALGRDLLTQLYVCLKTASFYDISNENFKKQLAKLADFLDIVFESKKEITATSVEGYLFFNEQRLKINLDGYLAAKYIQQQFDKLKVSGLAFKKPVTADELTAIILAIAASTPGAGGADRLNEALEAKNVRNVRFIATQHLVGEADESSEREERQNAKQTFFKAITVVQEMLTAPSKGRQISLIKAKRVIHSLVDSIIKNDSYLLELTALKSYDKYTFQHSVNVSIFSVALGLRLDLDKSRLAELGFAALFHDFGKTKIPLDLLNKPDNLNKSDWSLLQEHPVFGAKAIAHSFAMDRYTGRAILVAFEHHKNLDGTGYPYINRTREINLYSRIVSLCDVFDAMTSGRSYFKETVPVDRVILQMIKQTGVKFDPYLLKIMINILGIYPSGSLLLLDTGELALVVKNDPEDIFRPEVKIIADKKGKKMPAPKARLSSFDKARNRYFRNVVHLVDPSKYGIDISEYILED